jgi:hypothetical protein
MKCKLLLLLCNKVTNVISLWDIVNSRYHTSTNLIIMYGLHSGRKSNFSFYNVCLYYTSRLLVQNLSINYNILTNSKNNLRTLPYWCFAAYLVHYSALKKEVVYLSETSVTRLHDIAAEHSAHLTQGREDTKSPFTDFKISVNLSCVTLYFILGP